MSLAITLNASLAKKKFILNEVHFVRTASSPIIKNSFCLPAKIVT